MRDGLTFATVWLLQRIRSCALALLVALITTCITTTARASIALTVTSNPSGLSDTETPCRHCAEDPLRVPPVRAKARRLGAPGARSAASTHGPCTADTAPRGRRANNPTTLTDPEMRRELSYDSLDRITEVKRFVPSNATTPSHVETYDYNPLGGLAIHDGVALADQRPRLDGTGNASAGIPASLAGSPVGLDNGGRVTSLSGTNFTYYRFDHRLQNFVTGATTESFAYDALLRTTEFRRNGATVEVYLRDDLSDNIAAVSNGTAGLAGLRKRIIWDGVDHPLWMFDADRGVTIYFELDTTGNVRRLHAGERVTGNGSFTGDLGGYSYTAFGRNIPTTEPGGLAIPKIDAVDYFQRLQWQGRWLYNRSGGLYNFRARFWSPQLGAFLQLDRYQFLSSGGTLWSWPGQNPFRYGDPSGRIGFDGASTDRAIGADQDWGDPGFQGGLRNGGIAGAALGGVLLAGPVEFAVAAIRLRLSLMRAAAARAAAAALSVAIGGAKSCSGSSPDASVEPFAPDAPIPNATRLSAAEQATAGRLIELLGIPLGESPHVGAEYVDALGQTYDALGTPAASQFWNPQQFTNSIASHLLKSNNFTVIDLTGFTPQQIAEVNAYLGTLSQADLSRIIKVGF